MGWKVYGMGRSFEGEDMDRELEKAYKEGYRDAMEEMEDRYGERGGRSGRGGGYGERMWDDDDSITDKYLDFLRAEDYNKSKKEIDNRLDHVEQFNNSSQVASIKSFRILNYKRLEVETLGINEKVAIEVGYEVFDETILNPIIGVAIRTVDQKYVCGLNTLLDSIEIPWKRGQNKFYLEYPLGILAVGGKYFFDIAIFDKTATVPIHYISQVKEITVASPYVGEGIYIPPHEWRDHLYE